VNESTIYKPVRVGKTATIKTPSQIHSMLKEYDRWEEPRPDILLITPEISWHIRLGVGGSFDAPIVMEDGRIKEVFGIRVAETVDVEELTPVFLSKYR
jgi:hypothetical protein